MIEANEAAVESGVGICVHYPSTVLAKLVHSYENAAYYYQYYYYYHYYYHGGG